ncbi:DNA-binding transcriptional repressor PuuR [Variibacter gotjawalensis]|uniref:DNA-binding transcriptional repressor PuuR n=1 Tax=Variibacter gotjawalensis TaxID=1333996 RepID=A0A0S3PY16_9BRAD|nr:cupin domain-containing protein [Variibacter gotjawalensis]NIK46641.1 quercetin dioxygenase-like cupin family protein [Variibacter gotjawalensis]RZS48544.1 quercetin dioxygenase-like cupin family protein [Variibacter gotjawalensis]BAT60806.1 DNA-binding transcriptional repressor PuuR [Variibacter gotjawalensis]
MQSKLLAAAVVVLGLTAAPIAFAQNAITAKDVLRDDLNGMANQETIMQAIEIAPGGMVPWHTHPDGHEITYVIEGSLTLEVDGQQKRTLKAGDGFHIQPKTPHSAKNEGSEKAKILVVRLNEKGKPIAQPFQR